MVYLFADFLNNGTEKRLTEQNPTTNSFTPLAGSFGNNHKINHTVIQSVTSLSPNFDARKSLTD
jgi:hypothetical protein